MSRQIAVLMCAVNTDNQRRILEGMIDAAKETDSNLFVFSNYISYKEREENIEGAYQIIKLPNFEAFDGVIIAKNTIQYLPAAEDAVAELKRCKVPAVSIDVKLPGMSYIGISSYDAQMEMIEHFILEHKCEEIFYVTGPLTHLEGQKRYDAYCDALEKHGLEYRDEYVYQGFFDTESGTSAAEAYLELEHRPKVIVCANDVMAIGVIETLKARGCRIPEDVQVAGFDNSELSELYNPTITTVNKNQHEVGYRAVHEVLALADGAEPSEQYVSCHLEIRHSCGCKNGKAGDIDKLRDEYMHNLVMTQSVSDIMRSMTADFSGLETPEELVEVLKKYVVQVGMESFYLCLCDKKQLFTQSEDVLSGTLDILQVNTDYTDEITIPLAYENGKFTSYEGFLKGRVLPEECRNRGGGNYYVVVPIFYQRCCYGYCVSGNSRFPLEHSLYYSWLMNIGIGFENIRKWMLLKNTVVRLNGMWVYDMLTHLYNRAGFYHYANPMLEKMQEQGEEAFLMFLDIDGLKVANDTLGHEAGDALICGMAEVIKKNLDENQLAMRYGGDEFVIFGGCESEEWLEGLVDSIRRSMESRNRRKGNSYKLRASIGVSRYKASEITNLDELIERADKNMYEEKRHKHATEKAE